MVHHEVAVLSKFILMTRAHASLLSGRLCVIILCIVAILWVPLVQSSAGGQLFVYIQAVQGYLGTPIGALFLLAIFWKRMNEKVGGYTKHSYLINTIELYVLFEKLSHKRIRQ